MEGGRGGPKIGRRREAQKMRGVMKGCTTGVESRRDEEQASKGRDEDEGQRKGRSS